MDRAAGFVYIWTYEVTPENVPAFERLYGRDGDWARLFAQSPAYVGTELLRDLDGGGYLTIDRWVDEKSHTAFVAGHRDEVERLDSAGERLTANETLIGKYRPIV